jgi:hypothetical protein
MTQVKAVVRKFGEPETELEITTAMIEAGLAEFLDFDSQFEHDYRELVASIYEAMARARATERPVVVAASDKLHRRPESKSSVHRQ